MCVDQLLEDVEERQLERDKCCKGRYHLAKVDSDLPAASQLMTYCDETRSTTWAAYKHRSSSCSEAMSDPRSSHK